MRKGLVTTFVSTFLGELLGLLSSIACHSKLADTVFTAVGASLGFLICHFSFDEERSVTENEYREKEYISADLPLSEKQLIGILSAVGSFVVAALFFVPTKFFLSHYIYQDTGFEQCINMFTWAVSYIVLNSIVFTVSFCWEEKDASNKLNSFLISSVMSLGISFFTILCMIIVVSLMFGLLSLTGLFPSFYVINNAGNKILMLDSNIMITVFVLIESFNIFDIISQTGAERKI